MNSTSKCVKFLMKVMIADQALHLTKSTKINRSKKGQILASSPIHMGPSD
jgi:hypothetical protein